MISGGQQISFAVDARLNQYVEPQAGAEPGTLRELVNLRKGRDGNLVKRHAYSGTAATGNARGAVRGFDHDGQPILIDDTSVMAYGGNQDKWRTVDRSTNWTLEGATPVTGDTSGWFTDAHQAVRAENLGHKLYPVVVVGSGLIVHAWVWKQFGDPGTIATGIDKFSPPIQDLHGVYLLVKDEKTGAVLRGPERVSTQATGDNVIPMVRAAYSGGFFWIAWSLVPKYGAGSGTGTISAICVTASQLSGTSALPAGTALKGDLSRNDVVTAVEYHSSWDLCAGGTTGSPQAFLAYHRDNAGSRNLSVCTVTTTPSVAISVTLNSGAARAISVAHRLNDGYFWVAYALISAPTVMRVTVLATVLNASNSVDLATSSYTVVSTGIVPHPTDTTKALAAANTQEPTSLRSGGIMWRFVTHAAGAPSTSGVTHEKADAVMGSQPFYNGRDFYAWGEIGGQAEHMPGSPSPIDPTGPEQVAYSSAVLLALTHDGGSMYSASTFNQTFAPHLRVQAGRTNWGQYADYWFDESRARFQAPQRVSVGSLDSETYFWDGSIVLISTGNTVEFAHNIGFGPTGVIEHKCRNVVAGSYSAHAAERAGNLTLTTGGALMNQFDGQQLTEVGFCQPPRIDSAADTQPVGVSSDMGAGDYQWAIVYEFTDSAGNIHQSLPRFTPTVTMTANHTGTIVVRTLKVTRKQDYERRVRGTVTAIKPDSSVQIVAYRSGEGPSAIFYRAASVVNDPNQDTLTILDTSSAAIESGPILYTITGELVNECPPPATHAVTFNNRVAAIDAETDGRIYFSKPLRVGQGPAFSGVLETYVREIGKLTALAAMDGQLYAFSATGIALAAYGDGQDATGNGTWPQPQVISRAAGCIDPRALCVTQDGIVFVCKESDSNKVRFSIWLLPRGGGNIVEIGRPIHAYLNGTGTVVVGATPTSSAPTDVIGCDNWIAESRVVFTIRYTSAATIQLEYDYGNRGPDGLGVWNVSYVVGGLFLIGCTWTANGQHWLGGKSTDGYVLRSKAGTYADTLYTGGTEVWIPWLIETNYMKFGALAPRGKVNFVNVEFATWYNSDAPRSSYIKWTVTTDVTPVTTTMLIDAYDSAISTSSTDYLRARREWCPPVRRDDMGAGVKLRLESTYVDQTVDNQDAIPVLVHIDYIPQKGLRRPAAAQRV